MFRLRRRFPWSLLALSLLLLAAACQPAAATPSAAPTAGHVVLPTQTPAIAPTASPLPAASPTIAPAAPPSATPVLAAMRLDEWSQPSPDGLWVASGLAALPGKEGGTLYYARLSVAQVGGGQEWIVVDEWRPTGLGWTSPAPLRWSADGSAFYFTNLPHPDGCSVLTNGVDLHRLDLATGEVTELLPEAGLWISLSPDEAQVAYIAFGDRGLVTRDLTTGAESAAALDLPALNAQAGAIVWSPDAARLALTLVHNACSSDAQQHSVLVLELASGTFTTVLDRDPSQFITSAWPEPDRLRLTSPLGPYWLDLATGEITAA